MKLKLFIVFIFCLALQVFGAEEPRAVLFDANTGGIILPTNFWARSSNSINSSFASLLQLANGTNSIKNYANSTFLPLVGGTISTSLRFNATTGYLVLPSTNGNSQIFGGTIWYDTGNIYFFDTDGDFVRKLVYAGDGSYPSFSQLADGTNSVKNYADTTFPTFIQLANGTNSVKNYADTTFPTFLQLANGTNSVKNYANATFPTFLDLANGTNSVNKTFNANQFTTSGLNVSFKDGSLLTNPVVSSGSLLFLPSSGAHIGIKKTNNYDLLYYYYNEDSDTPVKHIYEMHESGTLYRWLMMQGRGVNGSIPSINLYNAYTDDSNYEGGFLRWKTNVFQIGAEEAGTGSAREMEVWVNGLKALRIDTSGILYGTLSGYATSSGLANGTNSVKNYADATFPTFLQLANGTNSVKNYADTTFPTFLQLANGTNSVKNYADNTFSTPAQLADGTNSVKNYVNSLVLTNKPTDLYTNTTVTINAGALTNIYGIHVSIYLTNNLTINGPTNAAYDGQLIRFRLIQNGTGGYSVTLSGSEWTYGTQITNLVYSTNANKRSFFSIVWSASASKWDVVGNVSGY